jgi:competence protein ComFC
MLESLIAIFAPHHCLACGGEGSLLCGECRDSLPPHPEICYRCHRLSPGARTCPACRRHTPLRGVRIATVYEGVTVEVVKALKFGRARAGAGPLGRLIAEQHRTLGFDLIVPVPSASSRQRQRGYNPAELIAGAVSDRLGVSVLTALGRTGQSRQVGARRRERIEQLAGAFYVRPPREIEGRSILLVDDVLTTGATLTECAKVLRTAGARSVEGAVVARNNN